jgi:hypothetical protein
MGRTLNQIIAALPRKRQAKIDAEYRALKDEVESLRKPAGEQPPQLTPRLTATVVRRRPAE